MRITDDEMTVRGFKAEYGAMKKEALRFVKEYFSDDDSVKSVKLGDVFWTCSDGDERLWEQGKPSNEDLIEWGDIEVGFEIIIKRKTNVIMGFAVEHDDSDFNIYSFFNGVSFKKLGQFDLEIR